MMASKRRINFGKSEQLVNVFRPTHSDFICAVIRLGPSSPAFNLKGCFAMGQYCYTTIFICIHSYCIKLSAEFVQKLRLYTNIFPGNITVICKRTDNGNIYIHIAITTRSGNPLAEL